METEKLDLTRRALSGVRALILLAGSIRETPFTRAINRSVLDLPFSEGLTAMDVWTQQIAPIAELVGGPISVRVILDGASPAPDVPTCPEQLTVSLERDTEDYRGTAGILSDLCLEYSPEDLVLVANAAQVPIGSFAEQVSSMSEDSADVSVLTSLDGTPSGLMLIRVGALQLVPRVGYVDFKEQALPHISASRVVKVARWRQPPASPPIRTLTGYITALRQHHRARDAASAGVDGPLAETWQPAYSVQEQGASVSSSAKVLDSVVLAGGRIEDGGVVVRSVVGPEGVVARGKTVLGEIVGHAPAGRARGKN